MRLIDADELLRRWDELPNRSRVEFDQVIMLMPIAYDADKVLEQLRKDKFIDCETILSDVHQGYNSGLSRAIDIVKIGRKNDD